MIRCQLFIKSTGKKEKNNHLWNMFAAVQQSPIKLFEIVMNFVTDNIDAVEHLGGVPELIGKALFNCILERNSILMTANALKLFVNAYGQAVASSVNLSKCDVDACITKLVIVLPHIVMLDLSYCGIVPGDEIMHHLGNLQLPRLERLSLEYNSLDDHCLRCLTMPTTMFGRGPTSLTELYLAGNQHLTCRGLRHLRCFPKLRLLRLSWPTNMSIKNLASYLKMEVSSDEPPFMVQTLGWAKTLFSSWKHTSSTSTAVTSAEEAKRFYGSSRTQERSGPKHFYQIRCIVLRKADVSSIVFEEALQVKSPVVSMQGDDHLMTSYLQYLP